MIQARGMMAGRGEGLFQLVQLRVEQLLESGDVCAVGLLFFPFLHDFGGNLEHVEHSVAGGGRGKITLSQVNRLMAMSATDMRSETIASGVNPASGSFSS